MLVMAGIAPANKERPENAACFCSCVLYLSTPTWLRNLLAILALFDEAVASCLALPSDHASCAGLQLACGYWEMAILRPPYRLHRTSWAI